MYMCKYAAATPLKGWALKESRSSEVRPREGSPYQGLRPLKVSVSECDSLTNLIVVCARSPNHYYLCLNVCTV